MKKIAVRVLPRAKVNVVVGYGEDGVLKVRLAAPPIQGKANQALIELLSEYFGVSKHAITILHGQTSRKKLIQIND